MQLDGTEDEGTITKVVQSTHNADSVLADEHGLEPGIGYKVWILLVGRRTWLYAYIQTLAGVSHAVEGHVEREQTGSGTAER
jgi:hypothetical protein